MFGACGGKVIRRSIDLCVNRWLFSAALARLAREFRPEALVLTVTHYATGFPALPAGLPVILDHVNECPSRVRAKYLAQASAVATVSQSLYDRAAAWGKPLERISNGVVIERYSRPSGSGPRPGWGSRVGWW